jgi:hypothetical protein
MSESGRKLKNCERSAKSVSTVVVSQFFDFIAIAIATTAATGTFAATVAAAPFFAHYNHHWL